MWGLTQCLCQHGGKKSPGSFPISRTTGKGKNLSSCNDCLVLTFGQGDRVIGVAKTNALAEEYVADQKVGASGQINCKVNMYHLYIYICR